MSRVLIVDDDPVSRMLLRHIVVGLDHEVVEAVDGLDALAVLDGASVDLVISDEQMPNLSGLELRDRLGDDFTAPFVLLTGTLVDGGTGDGRVNRYIQKPIGTAAVAAVLADLLPSTIS